MPNLAFLANGTLLKRGDGASPEVFTTVPGCGNFTGPNLSTATVDATDQESLAREFVLGLPDFGTLTCEMNWWVSNTTQNALRDDHVNRIRRNFQLWFPVTPVVKWSFTGLVERVEFQPNMDQINKATVAIKLTSVINFAAV